MAAPLRFIPEEAKLWTDQKGRPIAIAEVNIRTIQGRYLMKPTPENTDLLLGVIGRALLKSGATPRDPQFFLNDSR